jgi:flavin reductase ActVB
MSGAVHHGSSELCDAGFKDALTAFASGVTIVTTIDQQDWHGFTASAFCSLSAHPPLVLVCLATDATCYRSFMRTERFVVNILAQSHASLATRFATKRSDKFAGQRFAESPFGLVLPDAAAVLQCMMAARLPGGDHVILIGNVEHAQLSDKQPLVYHRRVFRSLPVARSATVRSDNGGIREAAS